ncbi:putative fatty-acid amide hydrolase [Xylaria bambusicola]|uniref:putative fatty-acid amide hydrolase n=1 Tax=Xylaria bambusicola TaxID=326684 RepID=UPI00200737F6|nr:putative fatty-acid amide hydrolase [Xylaria bambusicola]KAI0517048.1 putative fatty-acid amide hydrolase [Xylaria bambusicola]
MSSITEDYRAIAAQKVIKQRSKIPEAWLIPLGTARNGTSVMHIPTTCGLLSDLECEITSNYDATGLLPKLKDGTYSVEQVTLAFCKRAAIAHQLVNCLTEIFFDKAIERARELDTKRRTNPKEPLPPLFGLPISLKETFQVVGEDTSCGLACYVDEPAEENSTLVSLLLDLGAVLYCKTNIPQMLMTSDSDNNVFGRTLNPRNSYLTAGGSTGGEGALLALRGSILGVGTDLGGSIRIPSLCNGLYGFKPSADLVPQGGGRDLRVPGTVGVLPSTGPMATSVRDCSLFLKAILQAETWKYDSNIISLPWVNLKVKEQLRIGIVEHDGVFTPSPPVRRGLKIAADRIRQISGVEIIQLKLPNVKEHYQDLISYSSLSGCDYFREQLARTGEPVVPSLKTTGFFSIEAKSLQGFFDLNVRREEAAKSYLNLFRDNDLDAILMPPAPHTTLPLDTWSTATYTGLWNYLDYPAIVIPVDQVRQEDVVDDVSNVKFGELDAKVYGLYTGPESYKDAPVCVQLVGYRHADEALVNTAEILDRAINSVQGSVH